MTTALASTTSFRFAYKASKGCPYPLLFRTAYPKISPSFIASAGFKLHLEDKTRHYYMVEKDGTPIKWFNEVDSGRHSQSILLKHQHIVLKLVGDLEENNIRGALIYIKHKTLWKFLTGVWTPRKLGIVKPLKELILIC